MTQRTEFVLLYGYTDTEPTHAFTSMFETGIALYILKNSKQIETYNNSVS